MGPTSDAVVVQEELAVQGRGKGRALPRIVSAGNAAWIDLLHDRWAVLDLDDLDLALGRSWGAITNGDGFTYARTRLPKRRIELLHRLIVGALPGQVVDHINGDTLDNRRANLRVCSHRDNSRNRKVHKNNKYGLKGVHWDANVKRYRARIRYGGKQISLGVFNTPEDGHAAYCAAAIRFYGEFARAK